MTGEKMVLVLDFGGQNNQLIARRIRGLGVYCEVMPYNRGVDDIKQKNPIGIVFTGGPKDVRASDAPQVSPEIFTLGIPILAVGYGMIITTKMLGGAISSDNANDYAVVDANLDESCPLFSGIADKCKVWMNQTDYIKQLPDGFCTAASTGFSKNSAIFDSLRKIYAVQFYPEVNDTENGIPMLKNFLYNICGADGSWTMQDYAKANIEALRQQIGDGKVLLALSGGVDSSVVAALLSEAVGNQLTCIFVDHGLMRKNEGDEVEAAFGSKGLNFIRIDAEKRFLDKLCGVTDPERKRKIIGEEFIRVFEDESKKIGKVDFLAQGTIYPDIIESGTDDGTVIKSHHNVGGLPDTVDFKELVEPLKYLFKDEVRELGKTLGVPEYLVERQPFPGPGLGVRVIGEITKEKLDILRDADAIFREEIANAGLNKTINQYFAVITDMRSVGVTKDVRTYDYTLALRGVITTDFMTAKWAKIPWEVLERVSGRIVGEVSHINRIVYDITSKPPATIEWE